MKNILCLSLIFFGVFLHSQQFVKGYLINQRGESIPNCKLSIPEYSLETFSGESGFFSLELPPFFKKGDLLIETPTGIQQIVPLDFNSNQTVDLGNWKIEDYQPIAQAESQMEWDDLFEEDNGLDRGQIGSVLHSQRDVFLNTVAFQFSPTFFRLRGLDSRYQEVQLNGVPIRSFFKGTPQWNQWGGLNDFVNQGLRLFTDNSPEIYGRGGFLSTTLIDLQPSLLRSGTKVSQAFSLSSYRYRTQISVVKKPQFNKVGYGFLFSRRWGKQGYIEGTPYKAFSGAFLLEKNWSDKHFTWFTALYTPNSRGKNAPLTKEVFDLKGRTYNPYWGWQKNRIRNSRTTKTNTPILLLNHRWIVGESQFFQFNFGMVWGSHKSSRLSYNGHQLLEGVLNGGGSNPDPTYYQYLPSYALRNLNEPDLERAYILQQNLIQQGQLDWSALYEANQTRSGHSIYALYEDVQRLNQKYFNVHYTHRKSNGLDWHSVLGFVKERSAFYAQPTDLLGGEFLWDYNPYASASSQFPNNLLEANRKIEAGAIYQYHYRIDTENIGLTTGVEYRWSGWNLFGKVSGEYIAYMREGFFQNGTYPEESYGKGQKQHFFTFSVKGRLQYALTGRHHFTLQGQWQQKPPAYKNVYVNPRENQFLVPQTSYETNSEFTFSYLWQSQSVVLMTNIFVLQRKNMQEVGYYFATGIEGDSAFFVQEITQGLQTDHFGLEASVEVELLPGFKIAGVASLGEYRYGNNPQVYLGTAPSDDALKLNFDEGIKPMGKALLKNYHLAGGPQHAISISIQYEDPNFWRLSIFGNYFSRAFLDLNPVLRTDNFFTGNDGLPFADYDLKEAQKLLTQEQFPSYFLLNALGGKSWRIGTHYLGFFISIQNVLDTTFKTGGFEQGRNANFRNLKEDSEREIPLFSPKYWWGRGSSYFISTFYRF